MLYWFAFWLGNGLDKFFNRNDMGLFYWYGKERSDQSGQRPTSRHQDRRGLAPSESSVGEESPQGVAHKLTVGDEPSQSIAASLPRRKSADFPLPLEGANGIIDLAFHLLIHTLGFLVPCQQKLQISAL